MYRSEIKFFGAVIILCSFMVGSATYNNKEDNRAIEELVRSGATPAEAACAIRSWDKACVIAAGQQE